MKYKGIFSNLNKPLYISKKNLEPTIDSFGNEIVTYDEPFYLGKFNYQPLVNQDLYAYMQTYGETQNKLIRLFIDYKYADKIKEFDLAYLYEANPNNEEINGFNANYQVKTCSKQNTKVMIVFEEITKEGI